MSTRYSPDFKSLVARLLWMYGGNVSLVSHLTGVPERTIRSWRWNIIPHEFRQENPLEQQEQAALLPHKNSSTAAADNLEVLHTRLMEQTLALVSSLSTDADAAPFPQRAMALTRLIDRIVKLEAHVPSLDFEEVHIAFDKPTYEQDDDDLNLPDDTSQSEDNMSPDHESTSTFDAPI
jgi:transposase-like protein